MNEPTHAGSYVRFTWRGRRPSLFLWRQDPEAPERRQFFPCKATSVELRYDAGGAFLEARAEVAVDMSIYQRFEETGVLGFDGPELSRRLPSSAFHPERPILVELSLQEGALAAFPEIHQAPSPQEALRAFGERWTDFVDDPPWWCCENLRAEAVRQATEDGGFLGFGRPQGVTP
jgi:hypothetical protein